ncbi:MAG TPA: hypothetical protein VNN79_10300, partial [Actinomycetota bacterium]|nr:hypothetical protein [Actinomycetota bacterium]
DIQDIVGASVPFQPAVGGGYGGQTATGMSIVTSLAQKRFAAKKQQFVWAKGRVGEQWCALNQQFIEKERLVPIIGREGATDWEEIHPQELQGVYAFETEMVDESMLRQERRAEKQSMLQVAVSSAPVFAMTGQPLNLKAYMEDYLEEFGVQDTERYFSAKPQQLPMAGQSGQPGPPTNGTGTTNVDLAAGPTSPSNANSLSGVAALQQMGAMSGGAANGQ